MDSFLNSLGGGDNYDGGQRLPPGNNAYGGNYPAGGGYGGGYQDDYQQHAEEAARRAGNSGNADMFSNILSNIGQQHDQVAQGHIDEQQAVQHHQQFFGGGGGDAPPATSHALGSAAAMQALKMFTSGGGGSGGNQSQGQFMAMAMSEASKLFDQQAAQGNVAGGASKQSAIQKAGEMALQMYLKSQHGASGGAGGLMALASKFM